MKTFKIVATHYIYSKKKGMYAKNFTIEKDIASLEEAITKLKKIYPNAKTTEDPKVYIQPGMLMISTIKIK